MARLDLLTANDRAGAYPPSWYAATAAPLPPFPALAGEVEADVCVVGGGYTGLSAALHLAEAGLDVVLLEAQRVGWGASGRNGGQVGSGQRRDQDWLERAVRPRAGAGALGHGRGGQGAGPRRWSRGTASPATSGRAIIHAACRPGEVAEFHAEAEKLARDYGYGAIEPLDRAGIAAIARHARPITAACSTAAAAHLHPLNYALGLARAAAAAGVRIFEASRVEASVGRRPRCATAAGRGAGALRASSPATAISAGWCRRWRRG